MLAIIGQRGISAPRRPASRTVTTRTAYPRAGAWSNEQAPAIAWMIAGGTALLGNTPLGVRVANLAAGTAAVACIAAIARRLGGDRAAMRAALLLLCTPLAATRPRGSGMGWSSRSTPVPRGRESRAR